MGLIAFMLTICRLLFLIFNSGHFPVVYFTDFLAGFWFDLMTAAIVLLPLWLIEMAPNKWRGVKKFQLLLALCFHVIFFLTIAINLVDVEYFRHTSSRSSYALVKMMGFGNDLWQQLPSYFADYWFILLFAIIIQLLTIFLYKRINRIKDDSEKQGWPIQICHFFSSAAILVIIGRGGFGLRPTGIANAAGYTIEQNVQLVLNSAFTMIKTWGGFTLEEKKYFTSAELEKRYTIQRHYNDPAVIGNQNICLIVLESFSAEYISAINGTENVYTPFLDSLIDESLVFTNCYANGKKSLDAMPALISSIPKLMETEYLGSSYAANRIESLPRNLKKLGYSNAFFHGATNGSMNFDVFCDQVEFENYYGRTEYNNDADFDGTWGIYDEEFLQWSAKKMSTMKSPFFTTVFTVSSHPPYSIPEKYKNRFTGGPTEMHDAIGYADYALSRFFESAKKTSWYQNTLFVIVADHTPATYEPLYYKEMGNLHIPLIFFHPGDSTFRGRSEKVTSQADVMPGILHLAGYTEPFAAFGKSMFDTLDGYSASQIGNKFQYFGTVNNQHYMIIFEGEKTTGIFSLNDRYQGENLLNKPELGILEDQLKAIIQTYNHVLIQNKMTLD